MSAFNLELKAQLETQQSELTQQIRNAENNLLSLKETYLKVTGALEVLEVIKNKEDIETSEALAAIELAD